MAVKTAMNHQSEARSAARKSNPIAVGFTLPERVSSFSSAAQGVSRVSMRGINPQSGHSILSSGPVLSAASLPCAAGGMAFLTRSRSCAVSPHEAALFILSEGVEASHVGSVEDGLAPCKVLSTVKLAACLSGARLAQFHFPSAVETWWTERPQKSSRPMKPSSLIPHRSGCGCRPSRHGLATPCSQLISRPWSTREYPQRPPKRIDSRT